MLYENDAAPAGAVRRMRVPVAWLREYCDPGLPAEEIADALTMAGHQARAAAPGRRGRPGRVRRRAGCSTAERHPDADRLTRLQGRHRRRRAEHDRLRRAERGGRPDRGGGAARRDHARRHEARRGEAARRRVERDDPGRGRGRHRRGPRRDMVLDEDAAGRARRSPSTCRSPTRCSSSRSRRTGPDMHGRLRRRARPARGHRGAAGRGPDRRATPSPRATTAPRTTRASRSPTPRSACASPRACSRT